MPYKYGPYKKPNEIKLNYNCPENEKDGTGKGSCGGASGGKSTSSDTRIKSKIDYANKEVEKYEADVKKSLGSDLDKDVIDDFAKTGWKKPSDLDIKTKGLNIAVNRFKLSGDGARRYAEDYKKSYDTAWEKLIGKKK
jgi:hypothetical protein